MPRHSPYALCSLIYLVIFSLWFFEIVFVKYYFTLLLFLDLFSFYYCLFVSFLYTVFKVLSSFSNVSILLKFKVQAPGSCPIRLHIFELSLFKKIYIFLILTELFRSLLCFKTLNSLRCSLRTSRRPWKHIIKGMPLKSKLFNARSLIFLHPPSQY